METRLDLARLNEPQAMAALHDRGPVVVFAGAGSGKTRVIVHRIAHLVLDRAIPPWRILAVTFTNKAAGEMRERLEGLVPGAARELVVGTFHAVCARLLRRLAADPSAGLGVSRDFAIYDDADQKAMIGRILKDLSIDEKRIPPKTVASILHRAKNEMQGPDEVPLEGFDAERIREVLRRYEERMAKVNALDFGDLIYRMVRLLEANESVRMALAGRFVHLLVDEFQDTNHAQFRLVRALASVHRNVFVVGDDDQSIYRWRGADRRNILDFRRYFPDAEIVKLEQNYRSTRRILRAAHAIIEKNREREPKRLWTENPEGAKVRVVRCASERDEAEFVVRAARALRADRRPLRELAVFYRIHAQSRVLEEALRAARIPYRVVGGTRFYDRAEIKDLIAYLRLIACPEDDVSFLRIVNTPPRGIGKATIEKLLDEAAAQGVGLWTAAKRASETKPGSPLGRFVETIEALRARAPALLGEPAAPDAPSSLGLAGFAREVLERTGYEKALRDENTAESDARLENLAALVGSMQEFEDADLDDRPARSNSDASNDESTPEAGLLTRYLEAVSLQSEPDETSGERRDEVALMTVHAAKGLEFPHVIVVGMEEQLFPFRGTGDVESPEDIAEERRLAYVAFTRAERTLTLSWATSRYVFGNLRIGTRSRFLDELPASDVEHTREGEEMGLSLAASRDFARHAERAGSGERDAWGSLGETTERRALRGSSVPRVEPPADRDASGFRRGIEVRHVRYGVGQVRSVEGGVPPTVTVDFPGHGVKRIVAKYLEPV